MELEAAASTIEVSDTGIVIRWSDGARSRFHALWLRHNELAGDVASRTDSVADLNPGLFVVDAERNDEGDLVVEFSDGHESVFDFAWLRSASHEPHDRLGRPRTISNFRAGHRLDRIDLPVFGSASHCSLLEAVAEWGAALITKIPAGIATEDVAALVGAKRKGPADELQFTTGTNPQTIEAHRYSPCGLAIVHNRGSDTVADLFLVDGFGIATDMLEDDPDAVDQLSETRVPFVQAVSGASRSLDTSFEARASVITLDQDYELAGIRFDESTMAPLDIDPGRSGDYYDALIVFASMVNDPGRALQLSLQPGEAVIVDNHRVLSGWSPNGTSPMLDLGLVSSDRDRFHALLRGLRRQQGLRGGDERLPSGSTT